MEILLQHRANGSYVRGPGEWGTTSCDALVFSSSMEAIHFATQAGIISEVRVIVRFTQPPHHILVPLVGLPAAAPRRFAG